MTKQARRNVLVQCPQIVSGYNFRIYIYIYTNFINMKLKSVTIYPPFKIFDPEILHKSPTHNRSGG